MQVINSVQLIQYISQYIMHDRTLFVIHMRIYDDNSQRMNTRAFHN